MALLGQRSWPGRSQPTELIAATTNRGNNLLAQLATQIVHIGVYHHLTLGICEHQREQLTSGIDLARPASVASSALSRSERRTGSAPSESSR